MPGTYAHFALVKQAHSQIDGSFSSLMLNALDFYPRFRDLGAVTPDYPYFQVFGSDGKTWADTMHHLRTAQFVRIGAELVAGRDGEEEKQKGLAWLLGYASHVIADCIMHPVVNLLVEGTYEGHEREHRLCEMNQDAYIFPVIVGQTVNAAEYLDSSIKHCTSSTGSLDQTVSKLWLEICARNYPDLNNQAEPKLDTWHRTYLGVMDKIPELIGFLPFSRHIDFLKPSVYPDADELDQFFVGRVPTPDVPRSYLEVFHFTVGVILDKWREIDNMMNGGQPSCLVGLGEPNLDTGRDGGEDGPCVFWDHL